MEVDANFVAAEIKRLLKRYKYVLLEYVKGEIFLWDMYTFHARNNFLVVQGPDSRRLYNVSYITRINGENEK